MFQNLKIKILKISFISLLMANLVNPTAVGAIKEMAAVPNDGWKLENYLDNKLYVWWTPASCQFGRLILETNNNSIKNRFWALILTAKVSGKEIFIRYDDANNCQVDSFGMMN